MEYALASVRTFFLADVTVESCQDCGRLSGFGTAAEEVDPLTGIHITEIC